MFTGEFVLCCTNELIAESNEVFEASGKHRARCTCGADAVRKSTQAAIGFNSFGQCIVFNAFFNRI